MMGADASSRSSTSHPGNYAPDHNEGYHHDGYGAQARPPPQPYMPDPYMQHTDPSV